MRPGETLASLANDPCVNIPICQIKGFIANDPIAQEQAY